MIWKRFKSNKLALGGLVFMLLCVVFSVTGFLFVPDHSPDVNTMYPDLALKKPGFTCNYLHFNSETVPAQPHFLKKALMGWNDPTEWVAIDSFRFNGDSISYYAPGSPIPQHRKAGTLVNPKRPVTAKTSFLGTDRYGRDLFSRLVIGARVSIAVGVVAVFISVLIGLLMGLLAGYYRGWVDKCIMWIINIIWSLPTLMFIIALTFALGKGFWQIFVAVGLTTWVELARIVRGQVFAIRETEYIQAARVMGFNDLRIVIKHIMPNIWGTVIIMSVANFAAAILLEAGLSFLGQGLQPPSPSLGQMIKENYAFIVFDAAHLALFPGILIALLVMSVNFIGNGLRDAFDVNI